MHKLILRSINMCRKRFVQPIICRNFCSSDITKSEEMFRNQEKNRIVWIDMEMTGLEIDKHHVLEIACLVTDENLKIISDNFNMILNQPDDVLDNQNEWCKKHHLESGLLEAVKKSKENEKSVDESLLEFLKHYVPQGKCPMAGNSVYMDRMFLRKYMPLSNDYMHYRIIDVSSIKEVVKRWKPTVYNAAPKKLLNHRAIDDIRESIQELAYYKEQIFNATKS